MPKTPRSTTTKLGTSVPVEGATTADAPVRTTGPKKATSPASTGTTAALRKSSAATRVRKKKEVPPPVHEPSAEELAETVAGRQSKAQPAARAAARVYEPTLDEIAERAYEIYQRRGGIHGNDMDDWLEAERQLREEHATGE